MTTRRKARVAATCVLAVAIASGCAALLPTSQAEVRSPWHSYEEAKQALERIEPNRTTRADLEAAGIDPYKSPNITLLTFSDVVLRFPLGASVPEEKLDGGVRECLVAGKACSGYSITIRETKRDRTGDFWLDSLNFNRQVDVSGWSFNALILFIDDRVVYTLYGGQPLIREQEITRQPLGPLQGWGEVLPGLVH